MILGLVASVPVVAVAVHAVATGWVPDGDRADFAVRAYDVLTGRSPLLGPWSSGATAAAGEVAYSPGPMLFWLLAIPARFFDGSSLHLTGALVNLVSVVGLLALAHRRGGPPLTFATAVALPLMLASLPPEIRSDFWNSSAPLLPFALLVFLCWSLACWRVPPPAAHSAGRELRRPDAPHVCGPDSRGAAHRPNRPCRCLAPRAAGRGPGPG